MSESAVRAGLAVDLMVIAINAMIGIIFIRKIGKRLIWKDGEDNMPKSMIKRTITAGPLVMEAVYPASRVRDGPRVRQGKRELSSKAQQLMNQKYAWQKLKLLMAANFGPRDIFATFTYSDEHLPFLKKEVQRDLTAFVRDLRNERRKAGRELKYIRSIEHKHGEGRWHVHMLINATGDDYDQICRLWQKGAVEFRKIRVNREKNFETLAKYFCKEGRDKPGERLWSGSKGNLKKPERSFSYVPAGEVMRPPPEKRTAYRTLERKETPYGQFYYMEYVLLASLLGAPKARRRKKKSGFY